MKASLQKKMIAGIKKINKKLREFTAKMHAWQFRFEWNTPSMPEWFDHNIDLYYQWHKKRNPLWVERGCFNALALKPHGAVLELCCGDGFNAYYFYSVKARSVTAVDFDATAIQHAREYNTTENITYQIRDIRTEMPAGTFDNIIWDAAIEHFTEQEILVIMQEIKKRLAPGGILSGYTIVEIHQGHGLPQHESEFSSKEDLLRFFTPYFQNVKIFETIYESRHNLYFYASDKGVLPFDANWQHQIANYSGKNQ